MSTLSYDIILTALFVVLGIKGNISLYLVGMAICAIIILRNGEKTKF